MRWQLAGRTCGRATPRLQPSAAQHLGEWQELGLELALERWLPSRSAGASCGPALWAVGAAGSH